MRQLTVIMFLLAVLLPGASASAAVFYWPAEYNQVVNEKIALELQLKYLREQYANEKRSLLDERSELQNRIASQDKRIEMLRDRLDDEIKSHANSVADLEKRMEILQGKSGDRERALIDQSRKMDERYKDEIRDLRDLVATERDNHIREIDNLKADRDKKISSLEGLISGLRGEIADLKNLTEKQKSELDRMENQASALEKKLEEEIRMGDIRIRRMHDRLIININNKILFDSGSADLRKGALKSLDKITDILVEYPEYRINVEGHTDNVPISTARFRNNWQLSTERALSVLEHLLRNKNLKQERFSAVGFGEFSPLVPNTSAENKAQNRRVDISVVPIPGR